MKRYTLKKLQEKFNEWNHDEDDDEGMIIELTRALQSVMRRVSKLEHESEIELLGAPDTPIEQWLAFEALVTQDRAGKVTPERKSKYPVMEANSDRFSVDVIVKESDTLCRLIGYWDKLANSWWVYTPRGAEQFTGVESWQYITDPATTPPPTVAPVSTWVSVEERLPDLEERMNRVSINVIVLCKEGCQHVAYYNYQREDWTMTDSTSLSDLPNVIKWQPLGAAE